MASIFEKLNLSRFRLYPHTRNLFFRQDTLAYNSLKDEVDVEPEEDSPISRTSILSWHARPSFLNAGFVVACILAIVLLAQWPGWKCDREDREAIWAISDSETLLSLEKRRFTSAVRADPNGNLYLSVDPKAKRYAGLPSPEIDENWDELIAGRYFRLEDSEISRLNLDAEVPALTEMPASGRISKEGYYGGPDVLHSLHCLNAIRKHLDIDYYGKSMALPLEYRRIHLDHCVDHLRQALLCHGDLTPVTMMPVTGNTSLPYPVTFYLGQTERLHTCRNPEGIRRWVTERGRQTGRIEPIHSDHDQVTNG